MGSKFRPKMVFFLFWPAVLMYLITSCVSAGNSNLSVKNTEKIISGKTTKNEIIEVLGEPEQILKLDKEGLENYLTRVSMRCGSTIVGVTRPGWFLLRVTKRPRFALLS